MPTINTLKSITDFSNPDSLVLFKKTFDEIIDEMNAFEHMHHYLPLLHYIIRKLCIPSKEYRTLYELAVQGQNLPLTENYTNSMYALDIFPDWDESNPIAMTTVALNVGLPIERVLNYFIQNEIDADYNEITELFIKYGQLEDVAVINWNIFQQLNVNIEELSKKALDYYESLSFKPRSFQQNDHDSFSDAYIEYLSQNDLSPEFNTLTQSTNGIHRSLKFQMLYATWVKHVEKKGFTTNEDIGLMGFLLAADGYNHTDYNFLNKLKLIEILKTEYEKDNQVLNKFNPPIHLALLNNPWAVEYVDTNLINSGEHGVSKSTMYAMLSTNKTWSQCNKSHNPDLLKYFFITLMEFNSESLLKDYLDILPVAKNINELVETPISKEALALAMLKVERGELDTKTITAFNKIFPGFSSQSGRNRLIDKLIPNLKSSLKLEGLYSDTEIVKMVSIGHKSLDIKSEPLPELDV